MTGKEIAYTAWQVLGAEWGLGRQNEEKCRIMNWFWTAANGQNPGKLFPVKLTTHLTPREALKGYVGLGCGNHPANAYGAPAYKLDCLDCQKHPRLAWFSGSEPAVNHHQELVEALRDALPALEEGREYQGEVLEIIARARAVLAQVEQQDFKE